MTAIATQRAADPHGALRWREELGAAFNRLVPEQLDEFEPQGRLAGGGLGPLVVFEVSGSPQVVSRTPGAVRQSPAELLKICLQVRGRATVHQGGAEVVIEAGQMALYDTSRPYSLRLEGPWTCAVLAFPAAALGLPRKVLDSAVMRALPLDSGPGAVLAGFVAAAVAQRETIPVGASERLGEAAVHLVAGALSGCLPSDGTAAPDAARMQILAYIRSHLADPALCHGQVAAVHHIAARTLTRLFEDQPCTVTEYIRSLRLRAVRQDLGDPLLAGLSVAAIAARWCFTDQAHFTRLYRGQFGVTPLVSRRALLGRLPD